MRVHGGGTLYGREHELLAISRLTDSLVNHEGDALVIRGEPGAGKSALLADAMVTAARREVRVLPVHCARAEAEVSFAALHRLLQPVLPQADSLPARQRRALLTAVGVAGDGAPAGDASDLLAVSLAALELIASGRAGPTMAIIDDAHWLDEASGTVLSLVARRLSGRPGALLIARRDGHRMRFDASGVPELRLARLAETPARALLGSRLTGIPPATRDRLLDLAAGNPLALTELPAAWATQDTGGRVPLTGRLRQALTSPAADLPCTTRSSLIVAAAEASSPPADDYLTIAELLAAASIFAGRDVSLDVISPAIDAGVVEVRPRGLAFRHPLLAAAISQAASLEQRRAAHAALAQVLTGQPDRQVWHEAAVALGPDADLARRIRETASRAERRGAARLAATALERAAEFAPAQTDRGDDLLRAAEMAFDCGDADLGQRLLNSAESLDLATGQRAWHSWLRRAYADAGWPARGHLSMLVSMADPLTADGHALLAARSLRAGALRCLWGNPDQQTRAAISAAAQRVPLPPADPAVLAALACADPVRHGALVGDAIAGQTIDAADPAAMYLTGLAATAAGFYGDSLGFLSPAISGLRSQGRRGLLAQALACLAWAAVHLTRGRLAISAADEGARVARQTGQFPLAAAALLAKAAVAAQCGASSDAEPLIRDAQAELVPEGAALALVQFVRGRCAMTSQRYGQAAEQLRRVLDPADPACHPIIGAWGLADLAEAASRTGESAAATAYLRELESLARITRAPSHRAHAAYARPMLAGDDQAEALCLEALDRELADWPFLRGRMLLWYGRWLRRKRRIAESRVPLRTARDSFTALGLGPLAECAQRELRASGERRQHRGAADQLTAQELQISRLAAEGLSNREIGQQLSISHRTVGYHLHRVFPKLGITSRSQLHAAITRS
ncbi:MAG TPA: AAA family ATPase [Streptosporangiaceae bacterium]|nr:AAA family ATPase [Streptosporangiaceae bacterium]